MKVTNQKEVTSANLQAGEFNNCRHLFVELEPGAYQTLSVKLPNGKFVTFAFVPGSGAEFECVDIHSTVGKQFKYKPTDDKTDIHYQQHAIGFSRNGDTVDTRKVSKPTGLLTLLLAAHHHRDAE